MRYIVLNRDFGGPGFYDEKFLAWCMKHHPELTVLDEEDQEYYIKYDIMDTMEFRTSEALIQYVQKGEHKETGMDSLRLIPIPEDLDLSNCHIHNYDGLESLHENHRRVDGILFLLFVAALWFTAVCFLSL